MTPLKVMRIYLNDAVYKKMNTYRRGVEYPTPYILSVSIDVFGAPSEEHIEYIKINKVQIVDIVTYTTLFGDLSTTFRVNMGPVIRSTPFDDFAFLKDAIKNDANILLNFHSEDYFVREWSRLFVHLFEWSEEE